MIVSDEYLIPSNFCRYADNKINYKVVSILGQKSWVTEVRLPFSVKTKDYFEGHIESHHSDSIIFDGCSEEIKNLLKTYNFNSLKVGQEAILNLSENHFSKKSLKELIKRGLRHGSVKELEFSEENQFRLREFRQSSPFGKSPQLQHLFCNTFEKYIRLFAFIGKNGQWLGVITISYKTKNFIQTELIIRKNKNPIGIMEAIIFEIFKTLKKEGIEFWSLGAVPFVFQIPFSFSKQWLINFLGRRLRFAYNYKGLFTFKNKFMPTWVDYYICFNNNLTFLQLFDLMHKTKLFDVVLEKILSKLWLKNE